MKSLRSKERPNKTESRLRWSWSRSWWRSTKTRRKGLRELAVSKSQSRIRRRPSKEEWTVLEDSKKLLTWLPTRTRIKMKLRWEISSLSTDFSPHSWKRRWRRKWTGIMLLRMHSRRLGQPQDSLMWMRLSTGSWLENKHTLNFWRLSLKMREKLII